MKKEDESSQDPGTAESTGGAEDHGRLRDLVRVPAPHIRPYALVLGTLALINMIPGKITCNSCEHIDIAFTDCFGKCDLFSDVDVEF